MNFKDNNHPYRYIVLNDDETYSNLDGCYLVTCEDNSISDRIEGKIYDDFTNDPNLEVYNLKEFLEEFRKLLKLKQIIKENL